MAKKGRSKKEHAQGKTRAVGPVAPAPSVATQGRGAAQPHAPSAPESAVQAPRSRSLANALIAAVLLYEIVMPLRYYLGGGGSDERFSWRMFSTVRMQKCSVVVDETAELDGTKQLRPVDLHQALQIAWIGMLERNRPPVVDKLLQRRCEDKQVREAHYHRTCTDTDGTSLPPLEITRDCARGTQHTTEGTP
jgi:hypothetical protein